MSGLHAHAHARAHAKGFRCWRSRLDHDLIERFVMAGSPTLQLETIPKHHSTYNVCRMEVCHFRKSVESWIPSPLVIPVYIVPGMYIPLSHTTHIWSRNKYYSSRLSCHNHVGCGKRCGWLQHAVTCCDDVSLHPPGSPISVTNPTPCCPLTVACTVGMDRAQINPCYQRVGTNQSLLSTRGHKSVLVINSWAQISPCYQLVSGHKSVLVINSSVDTNQSLLSTRGHSRKWGFIWTLSKNSWIYLI